MTSCIQRGSSRCNQSGRVIDIETNGSARQAADRSCLSTTIESRSTRHGATGLRRLGASTSDIHRGCPIVHLNKPGRNITMRKSFSIALTLMALFGTAPLLGACHTTAGAGQDISATGHVLTNSARKNTP